MEFVLLHGKPERTHAMKAGSNRHAQLEEEVVKKVEVRIHTFEDSWALRLTNFVVGANQLMFDGLTSEVPILILTGLKMFELEEFVQGFCDGCQGSSLLQMMGGGSASSASLP